LHACFSIHSADAASIGLSSLQWHWLVFPKRTWQLPNRQAIQEDGSYGLLYGFPNPAIVSVFRRSLKC
ncbi:MAG: hypothetical protein OXF73_04600, partial [Gammaproteobacteria bacterium]|nr:hypothetical protein [Gammaproteobacteria bacterium]